MGTLEMVRHEGVGIKAHGGLEWKHNTKIGSIAYSQVYPNFNITDIKRKYR
jgi:hypothetical protein